MSAARRVLLLAFAALAAAALAPARAEVRCTAVRVTYTGTQPVLFSPTETLLAFLFKDRKLLKTLESTPATQELVLMEGRERLRLEALTTRIEWMGSGFTMWPKVRLVSQSYTEWRMPDGSRVAFYGASGEVKRYPPASPELLAAIGAMGLDPSRMFDSEETGHVSTVAGRPCRWFAGSTGDASYSLRHRMCMTELGGQQVALVMRIEQVGAGATSHRPYEMRAERVEEGACVDTKGMRPPPGAKPVDARKGRAGP